MPAHPFRNRHPNRATSVVTRMGGRSIRGNTSTVWTSDVCVRLPAGRNVYFPDWQLTAGRVPAWTIGRNEGGGNGVGVARKLSMGHASAGGGERDLDVAVPLHEPAVRGPLHRKGDDRGDAGDIFRVFHGSERRGSPFPCLPGAGQCLPSAGRRRRETARRCPS